MNKINNLAFVYFILCTSMPKEFYTLVIYSYLYLNTNAVFTLIFR